MSDWRLSFFRGEASLEARQLALGPAQVDVAILRLIDVAGPVHLEGGIEPFANHRTALERLEITLDPAAHLQGSESVRYSGTSVRISADTFSADFALDRFGDRGRLGLLFHRCAAAGGGSGDDECPSDCTQVEGPLYANPFAHT